MYNTYKYKYCIDLYEEFLEYANQGCKFSCALGFKNSSLTSHSTPSIPWNMSEICLNLNVLRH
jgi:hypothetical protein